MRNSGKKVIVSGVYGYSLWEISGKQDTYRALANEIYDDNVGHHHPHLRKEESFTHSVTAVPNPFQLQGATLAGAAS